MFNVVIFGPPGSGKGTQSLKIKEKYGLIHLSTGDVLRDEIKSGSELGKEISRRIDDGNFVPDEMIQEMVIKFILSNKDGQGFILDGFPRTTSQAEWLDNRLAEINQELTLFLSLEVSEEELKQRILSRGKFSGREDDRNEEIIETRIRNYHKKTKPVIEFYKQQLKFTEVNGIGTKDEIFSKVCNVLDNVKVQTV